MNEYDLIVIGAGPGGYVAAIRAAQLGLRVACVDENDRLGGTCLRIGCIPSKALLESSELYAEAKHSFADHGIAIKDIALDLAKMQQRKESVVDVLAKGIKGLFGAHNITQHYGRGKLLGDGKVRVQGEKAATEIRAKHILIATGSVPALLKGVDVDHDRIGTSTTALGYDRVPEHLVVIGAGYIGLELGTVWNRLGAKVTVLEYLDRILPGTDAEVAKAAHRIFAKQGLDFRLGSRVTSARVEKKKCIVECEGAEPITADRVLLATGRVPNTKDLGLETAGVRLDRRGFIQVDEHFATAARGVYAIGDVIGGAMLAHKAEDEGVACVEAIATGHGRVNYNAIPAVIYTNPEIAAVGRTEEQLKEAGVEYRVGKSSFRANGRARGLGQIDGFVKMLADRQTDRILGVHILGPRAGDLIAETAVAIAFGASSEDIARTSHAHPTLAEVVRDAAKTIHN